MFLTNVSYYNSLSLSLSTHKMIKSLNIIYVPDVMTELI